MPKPFIVLGLPRSRTAWLSKFLTYDGWVCGHEELQRMRSLKDIKTWFNQPYIGTVETAAAPWWRLIDVLVPSAKILVIRRPVNEVVASLINACPGMFNYEALVNNISYMDRKLGQLAKRLPNVMSADFKDLDNPATCAKVFEFCLEQPFDYDHWLKLKDQNIQINLPAMLRYAKAYQEQLQKLGAQATNKIRTQLSIERKRIVTPEGITIQREPLDMFMRDGSKLFEQHCTEVGELSDQWQKKNIPLMNYFDEQGLLQIMVARSNGRMFGYLITVITPSLVEQGLTSATHSTFYADPSWPGLGLKIQRAANASLKLGGVDEVFMQTGTRGAGDRLDIMYERIGAENVGQFYRLDLREG